MEFNCQITSRKARECIFVLLDIFFKMVKNRFYSFIKKVYNMDDFSIKNEFIGKVYTNSSNDIAKDDY